jgi:transposase
MKKFAGRVQKIKTDVIGLDVHKDVIAYSHFDVAGEEVHDGTLASEGPAVLELIRGVTQGREVHVAMEASGGMLWLFDLLAEHLGAEHVHVAQPRRIRAIANSQQKNDANDAYWLAYYTYEGRLPAAWMPTGKVRELRLAVRARMEAVKQRSRATVLLKGYLRQMGEKLPGVRMDGQAVLERVRELAAQTAGMLGLALRRTLARYEAAAEEVEGWDEALEALSASMPEVEKVRRNVPGVGTTLAAMIVAESGPIERFPTAKAYAKYTGMTPADRSTGGRTIHGGMTRQGSRYLRWALSQAVMGCLRSPRELGSGPRGAVARWVDAKERRMGSKAKARVAAARKLATSIWWLFHRPQRFDVFKPFGGLAPQAAS